MNYSFVSLSPRQLDDRRILLNQAGYLAWLSPIFAGFLIASFSLVLDIGHLQKYRSRLRRLLSKDSPIRRGATNSRPSATQNKSRAAPPSALKVFQRRAAWVLNQPISSEFGAVKLHILGAVYLGWLFFLTFRETGDDYMHLTKAFGHVAVSQLPWQYLLAIKTPFNPVQLATGLSHEDLNDLHRLFGRIIHVLLAAHAILYLRFFAQIGVLAKRVKDRDVRLGLIAFWSFNILGLMAIPIVRKKAYHKLFYRSHVLITALILPVLFLHVPYTRRYVVQAGVLYLLNGLTRAMTTSKKVSAKVDTSPDNDLIQLSIDGAAAEELMQWQPGQHVYIKSSAGPMSPRTPFTVVSWPHRSSPINKKVLQTIDLVIRNLRGPQTSWLAAKKQVEVTVEGPYGEARNYVPELTDQENDESVLFVAGGVGATYTMPIYLRLLEDRRSSERMRFVWLVRSLSEARWGLQMLDKTPYPVDVTIYITRPTRETEPGSTKPGFKIHAESGRPHLKDIVASLFGKHGKVVAGQRVHVFACGPPGLSKALRRDVGRQVWDFGTDVIYHEEQFGLGSS